MAALSLAASLIALAACAWAIASRRRVQERTRQRDRAREEAASVADELARSGAELAQAREGQARLATAEERFRGFVEAADDFFFRTDPELRFTYLNPAALEAFGGSAEELVGRPFLEVVRPDYRERARRFYEDQRLQAIPNTYCEFPVVSLSGRELWVGQRVQLVFEQGHLAALQALARDVTERNLVEQAAERARQAALEASRLKSEFVANMSHEVRTPMNGVVGMTRLLLETPLTAEQREYAELIDQSGRALLAVVDDILDFSKIEAGHLDLDAADFGLRRAVRQAIAPLAEAAARKGVELLCLIGHDVPDALRGDPGRLRQVLVNLVGNAVKFTEQGEVSLRVGLAESDAESALVRFEVRDTGPGIAIEQQAGLFEPFVQGDGSATRRHGGTGLGLAISKRLVSMMGGSIELESRLGAGSTFRFTVRFGARPGEEPHHARPSAVRLAGRRVLVVDDNATNREILRQQLRHWGLRVTTAASGAEALSLLRRDDGNGFELVVIDMKMPGMDGLSLAQAIKTVPGTQEIRLVLLSSLGERGHGAQAARIGISAYLTKPVAEEDLHDCLLQVLGAPDGRPARLVTRHTLGEARLPLAATVLVAEDNEVNQKVAARLLERLGYGVEVAEDGEAALCACAHKHYDAVLMDSQMPRMDGFEATRRIRQLEQSQGRRTPIIAMTASAMTGDRERCLEAGMDDYLTKPVTPERLRETLERWVGHGHSTSAADPTLREAASEGPALDESVVEALVAIDDGSLLDELAEAFQRAAGERIGEMRRSVGQAALLERAAHSLFGTSANLGCRRLADLCARLETTARAGTIESAPALVEAIEREYLAVRPLVAALPARRPARAATAAEDAS